MTRWRSWRLRVWRRRLLLAKGRVDAAAKTYGDGQVALCRRDAVERAAAEVAHLETLLLPAARVLDRGTKA